MATSLSILLALDPAEDAVRWHDYLSREANNLGCDATFFVPREGHLAGLHLSKANPDIDCAIIANPDHNLMQGYHGLRMIQSLWAGVETVVPLVQNLRRNGGEAKLARLIDPAMSRLMAQYCVLHVLADLRHLRACDVAQACRTWVDLPAPMLEPRVLILGAGKLGLATGQILAQLGCKVTYWARTASRDNVVTGQGGLYNALAEADYVLGLLPLTPSTAGLMDRTFFAQMKSGSMLVHAGRGAHYVEADLLEALQAGRPRLAVLDVFETEPLVAESVLWYHPRIMITPHVAAPTPKPTGARFAMENLLRWAGGDQMIGEVQMDMGY